MSNHSGDSVQPPPLPWSHGAEPHLETLAAPLRKRADAGRVFDLEHFIQDRQARWTELELLLNRAQEHAADEADRATLLELVRLYRLAASDLNLARTWTANPELLGRLNQLVGRGYRMIYRAEQSQRGSLITASKRFLLSEIPATFRLRAKWVLLAATVFLLGAVVGAVGVALSPSTGEALIPSQFFSESPAERVERIEEDPERIDALSEAAAFGASLYTHNIQVAFLSFSLGAATIIGGWLILFYNGMILGAVGMMYVLDGVSLFFFAWVGPHGALELPSIVFASAAGLLLGQAIWLPGERGRAAAMRGVFGDVWRMLAASALILVCAGLIEGSFSQFSLKTVPYSLKISVATILFGALVVWLWGINSRPLHNASLPPRGSP